MRAVLRRFPTHSGAELAELEDGMFVNAAALDLAATLQRRGYELTVDEGRLSVRPAVGLTPADIAAIKRYRFHLMELTAPYSVL